MYTNTLYTRVLMLVWTPFTFYQWWKLENSHRKRLSDIVLKKPHSLCRDEPAVPEKCYKYPQKMIPPDGTNCSSLVTGSGRRAQKQVSALEILAKILKNRPHMRSSRLRLDVRATPRGQHHQVICSRSLSTMSQETHAQIHFTQICIWQETALRPTSS